MKKQKRFSDFLRKVPKSPETQGKCDFIIQKIVREKEARGLSWRDYCQEIGITWSQVQSWILGTNTTKWFNHSFFVFILSKIYDWANIFSEQEITELTKYLFGQAVKFLRAKMKSEGASDIVISATDFSEAALSLVAEHTRMPPEKIKEILLRP